MNGASPLWTITKIEDTNTYNPVSGAQRGKRIRYTLHDGTQSFIDLPISEFNAQTVQDTIHKEALKHEQVMSLSGPDATLQIPRQTPPVTDLIH